MDNLTADGTNARDYMYVPDLAHAYLNSIDYMKHKDGIFALSLECSARDVINTVGMTSAKEILTDANG